MTGLSAALNVVLRLSGAFPAPSSMVGKAEVRCRAGPPSEWYLSMDQAGHDVGTCGGGEEDLAAREVLSEPLTGRVDPAVLGPERTGGTAACIPGRADRRVGIESREWPPRLGPKE